MEAPPQAFGDICIEKNSIDLFLSLPIVERSYLILWVTDDFWRLGESSTMQHLWSVHPTLNGPLLETFLSYVIIIIIVPKACPLLTENSTGVLTIPPAERIIS